MSGDVDEDAGEETTLGDEDNPSEGTSRTGVEGSLSSVAMVI